MAFEAFRENGAPTNFEAVQTPWEADLLVCGLIFCFSIVALSFYIIAFGLTGKEMLFSFARITLSLYIGAAILVTNFSMTWDTAKTCTMTQYKAGTGTEVNVTIGVNIGFRGVNITLKGKKDQIPGETIDYNEHFSWVGLQGRLGFGPFAGKFNREYRAAQLRGLPLPILWAAEYFTIDGEGIRWGRFYRQAGWYAHIMLWLAFPLWILSNILFLILLRYGAFLMTLTGLSMVTANIIWVTWRNELDLRIPYTATAVLDFSYGASFWICLGTGAMCVFFGLLVFFMDKLCPNAVTIFFGVDILQDSESVQVEGESDELTIVDDRGNEGVTFQSIPEDDELYTDPSEALSDMPEPSTSTAQSLQIPRPPPKRAYRTNEHRITKRFQRPRRRDVTSQAQSPDDDSVYTNVGFMSRLGKSWKRKQDPESAIYENSGVAMTSINRV